MYNDYFGFKKSPFSIAPDPHYLFMTAQHREALAHLVYGLDSDGGCILLTGEVGTGKTTICRCLLEQIPEQANVALLLNPKVTAIELLETICDEFKIKYPKTKKTIKTYVDLINQFLLESNARGEKTILIIDEAQNLDNTVLEQLRLLTNLETDLRKLLQIVLLGQPELLEILAQEEMRQLAQRITARFHLKPLSKTELKAYISHRLAISGQNVQIFPDEVIKRIYQLSKGIPRLINVICDRSLLGTYVQNKSAVDLPTLNQAAIEISGELKTQPDLKAIIKQNKDPITVAAALILITILVLFINLRTETETTDEPVTVVAQEETKTIPPQPEIKQDKVIKPAKTIKPKQVLKNQTAIPVVTRHETPIDNKNIASSHAINSLITNTRSSKSNMYSFLFKLWGIDYKLQDNGNACKFGATKELLCLYRSGDINSLLQFNRPAMIKLNNQYGKTIFAALTHLDDKIATINTGKEELIIDIATLKTHWYGEYILLWKKPPHYEIEIHPGHEGPIIEWLNNQMAKIYGNKPPADIGFYSNNLVNTVKLFQRSKGLHADGIAGPRTFIHINNAIGLQTPKLTSETSMREN